MVYAIVVTYNPDLVVLERQYNSIVQQVDKIIYIDNSAQINDSFRDKNCVVINNNENKGLAYAQNQGIDIAIKEGADFVILFDQDSLPPFDFKEHLMCIYEEVSVDEKVALVGPAIINAYEGVSQFGSGIVINTMGGIHRFPLKRITKVSYCIASGSLIPIPVLLDVGKIEEKLFIDALDLEWCLRAKKMGFSIIQTNTTSLSHYLGNGLKDRVLSHSPFREYFIVRNNIWLIKQSYIPLGYRLRKCLSVIYRLLISLINGRSHYLKKQLNGIKDGYHL